jgi:hypothetical protein
MAEKRTIELEVKSNLDESTESVKSLKAQLKELKAQLALLDEGSDEFKKLVRQAGELEDRIGDVNQQVKNFASDTRNLDVAMQGVSAASGAFEAFEGTMALVGVESEDLQKTMVKLQAVMAVTNGIQSVANALNKDSALTQALNTAATKGAAIAQTVYTAVVGASTGALKAFKIALATTGIGLLVVAIGYAVQAMGLFEDKTKDEEKAQKLLDRQTKQLEKTIESYNNATAQVTQTIDNATRSELALARQRGASQAELTKITKRGVQDRLDAQGRETEGLKQEYLKQSKLGTTENYEKARKAYLDSAQKTTDLRIQIQEIDADIAEEQRQSFQQTVSTATTTTQEIVSLIDQINTERIKQIEDEQKRRQAEIVEAARIRKKEIKETVANAKEKATLLKLVEDNMLVDIAKLNDEFFQKELDKEKEQAKKLADQKIENEEWFKNYEKKLAEEKLQAQIINTENEDAAWQKRNQNRIQARFSMLTDEQLQEYNSKKKYNDSLRELDRLKNEGAFKSEEEYLKAVDILQDDYNKKGLQKRTDLALKYAKTFVDVYSSLNNLMNASDNERLSKMEKGSKEEEALKKKMFKRDKALRIVQTVMDTASNVVQSVRNGGGIPTGIPFGIAAATMGALQIAAISKAKFDGGNQQAPSAGGGGAAAPMTANFNTIGSSGINQLAQLQQTPTQAYVVSGEVTSAQALDRNRVQNATL